MPFDEMRPLTLTRLEKLERLKMLADKATGEQWRFCSCLLHDAQTDPILAASGLPDWSHYLTTEKQMYAWFGRQVHIWRIFGGASLADKREYLASLITKERTILSQLDREAALKD